ncbi:MAG: UDP-N-acetylmuramoyl-tripeptide--D-alanyl-D-alanine ligase [Chlorobiaceae bacterium]|nr:UDP-N-acetylmuramoyl-tripeptide--D-alanyl-D-alanine ligase [Chlorobiaceae bacterium]
MNGVLSVEDFRGIGDVVTHGSPLLTITAPVVVIDSREVKGGELFVALKGERTDGHCYVSNVFQQGASWVMVSREWYEKEGSPQPPEGKGFIVTVDPVAGLQQLALCYRNTFSIPVVAIGGSNGKTTTKEMVASVLATGFTVHMSQGNRNNHLGVPLTLLQIRPDTGIAVVEVGINHPGEMEELTAIARPTHGLLTNIGHEHLEFLIDLDGVAAAETQLFTYLQESGGTAFVNGDDARLRSAGEALDGPVIYGTAELPGRLCWARDISVCRDGRISFVLCSTDRTEPVTLNFTGKHNVINAVAAAAVGLHFGLPLSRIREGLESLVPATGWKRLEVMDSFGLRILNDTYNANSDSMRLAIDALCDLPCEGKRIAVLGDMLELGAAGDVEHESIGRYIHGSRVDLLFVYGEKARLICRESPGNCQGHFSTHEELLEALLDAVHDGDAILFKGSRGMKLERVVEALMNVRTNNR